MNKRERLEKIKEILKKRNISSQKELMEALKEEGIYVVQATLSRDLKELGVIRQSSDLGKRYIVPENTINVSSLKDLFHRVVVNIDFAENLILVKTLPGNAQAVAFLLDNYLNSYDYFVGSVAGDDTILIVLRSKDKTQEALERLEELRK
ncbi:arginine repressor [Dictyoglomus thermophilum]|uniref:Arginine repressor n=1 Tax=Dictyoglomus thermophilum (strain ATCC 35947 / DSM 3960 / H-6-12) TaxID=309799 RepID=B5YE38_DICT6|nr:arginine repressor [Dictyoglomus thermophilum]ACI18740.1 arginine repressor [Dictyoglomus thermophilum H-6-12]TYT22409.1 arginine repressor [Dictyoglomus thermophilum]